MAERGLKESPELEDYVRHWRQGLEERRQKARTALRSEPGRQILNYLLMYCQVWAPFLETGEGLAKKEGRRQVALELLHLSGFVMGNYQMAPAQPSKKPWWQFWRRRS